MFTWLRANQNVLGGLFVLSAILFLVCLVAMPVLIARMRPDHFLDPDPPEDSWRGQHPVVRWVGKGVKNLLGLVLVLAGLAMLVLPGQGIITILVGISLLDFPGRRALELRIVRQRHVLQAVQWIRRRAGQPPLELPPRRGNGSRPRHEEA
jgi:hypothetical protein